MTDNSEKVLGSHHLHLDLINIYTNNRCARKESDVKSTSSINSLFATLSRNLSHFTGCVMHGCSCKMILPRESFVQVQQTTRNAVGTWA